jgi:hypothetical protein
MSREEPQSSNKHATGSRRRRRRLARLILGDAYAQATEYPGFFVLPRRQQASSAAENESRHPRWAQFKQTAVLLLVLGGFVAVLAYFFYHTGKSSTTLRTEPPADVDKPRAPY